MDAMGDVCVGEKAEGQKDRRKDSEAQRERCRSKERQMQAFATFFHYQR